MTDTKAPIQIPDFITIRDLADLLEKSPIDVIKQLMSNGIMANISQQIDYDTASIVAEEMGFETVAQREVARKEKVAEEMANRPVWKQIIASESESDLQPRPPVVTMLGHVDHGKTSLLDFIRRANVTAGEAGGITQHIGAYQARHEGRLITFLDTPGHEAFTAMRARGAQATDIAILVIAADDGMMPQTREAIDHARAAGVAIIVAINKIDLATARPERVKQQLAEIDLVPDDWNGDTLTVEVSATQGLGVDDLLEAILLTAEELEPRANPQASPTGTILEARMKRGLGVVTTLLVQNGTLKVGDTLITGEYYGRIKSMTDYTGKRVKKAGPSTPVSVSGLSGMPSAGDQFGIVANEKEARRMVSDIEVEGGPVAPVPGISLDDFYNRLVEGETKTLNLIVKTDVEGSLEPVVNSLEKLTGEEVTIDILRAAAGRVTENDVMLAAASDAVVLGFNVQIDNAAEIAAANQGVEINTYKIIYKLLEDVEKSIKGMREPVYEEAVIGRAEVRQIFRIRGAGLIAGSYMRVGEARRNASVRVIRNSRLLHSGGVSSLKRLQENVREVKTGFEFGVGIEGWNDLEEGDILEFFVKRRVE
jgi:translation initiation factor IF-2